MRFDSSIIGWLDDRMNPIVVKELRQGVQSRFVVSIVNLLIVALVTISAGAVIIMSDREMNASGGRDIFATLQGALFVATMSLLPGYAMFRLRNERGANNVDLYFITTLTARKLIRGKFLATMSLATMLYSVCLPFMLFTYMLKGYDIPSMLTTMAMGYIMSAALTMVALVIGAVTSGRTLGLIVAVIAFIFSFYVSIGFSVLMAEALYHGVLEIFEGTHGIYFTTSILIVTLLAIRLAEAMAVGLVSAPSSNRTIDLRIWSSIFLIVTGAIVGGVFYFFTSFADRDLLFVWLLFASQLVVVVLAIGISEPEGYSNRLLRQRPKTGVFRFLSLPFMGGVTGGIWWAVLHIAAVIILADVAFNLSGSSYSSYYYSRIEREFEGIVIWSFYMFAYALSARLLMRTILKKVPVKFGWGIMLLLMAVLMISSLLISFLVMPSRFSDSHEWMLFNPFMAIDQSSPEAYYFLSLAWAIAVLALNAIFDFKNVRDYMFKKTPIDDSVPLPLFGENNASSMDQRYPGADEVFESISPVEPGFRSKDS